MSEGQGPRRIIHKAIIIDKSKRTSHEDHGTVEGTPGCLLCVLDEHVAPDDKPAAYLALADMAHSFGQDWHSWSCACPKHLMLIPKSIKVFTEAVDKVGRPGDKPIISDRSKAALALLEVEIGDMIAEEEEEKKHGSDD